MLAYPQQITLQPTGALALSQKSLWRRITSTYGMPILIGLLLAVVILQYLGFSPVSSLINTLDDQYHKHFNNDTDSFSVKT